MHFCCFRHIMVLPCVFWSRKWESLRQATLFSPQMTNFIFPRLTIGTFSYFYEVPNTLLRVICFENPWFTKTVLLNVRICFVVHLHWIQLQFVILPFCCCGLSEIFTLHPSPLLFNSLFRPELSLYLELFSNCHSLCTRVTVERENPLIESSFQKCWDQLFLYQRSSLVKSLKSFNYQFWH